MNYNLMPVKYFVDVVQTNGFISAAKRNYVSETAVSSAIKKYIKNHRSWTASKEQIRDAFEFVRNCLRSGLNFDIFLQKRKLSCLIILVISPVSSLK